MRTMTTNYRPTRPIMDAAELDAARIDRYGRDYDESDDGYSDMEAEHGRGWEPLPAWGRDGWDLGEWPYTVIYRRGALELMQICEGDRTVYRFATSADRDAACDYLFVWYGVGKQYEKWVAAGLDAECRDSLDAGLLVVPFEFRGPYRDERAEVTS